LEHSSRTSTRILIAGSGAIGSAIARDLVADGTHEITVADRDVKRLERAARDTGARTQQADLSDLIALTRLISEHDIVIGALPSVLGFQTLRTVIAAGRSVVDVSFMAEDPLALDALAREHGAVAVVDCGLAPGLSHMVIGFATSQMSTAECVAIYVGGLPAARGALFDYKSPFSPFDVMEEYTRPAHMVENGRLIIREALSEPELLNIEGFGTLEAFLTDGLSTLTRTVDAQFMMEKTLRYPGHRAAMAALRDGGLFSTAGVDIDGCRVRPIDVTTALLFPRWQYEDDEPDLTILRVVVEGQRDGRDVRCTADLIDRYDPATRLRSMSRTTAYPAASVARLVERGSFTPGVHPPETVGRQGLLDVVLQDLDARGVHCIVHTATTPHS
jgi:saccharopine dehydrogenase-like NADP-dependent oxidoreductase